jgi:hypothetical protein
MRLLVICGSISKNILTGIETKEDYIYNLSHIKKIRVNDLELKIHHTNGLVDIFTKKSDSKKSFSKLIEDLKKTQGVYVFE